jgi:hypothetical protein
MPDWLTMLDLASAVSVGAVAMVDLVANPPDSLDYSYGW